MDADGFVRIADFGLCKEGKSLNKAAICAFNGAAGKMRELLRRGAQKRAEESKVLKQPRKSPLSAPYLLKLCGFMTGFGLGPNHSIFNQMFLKSLS